MGGIPGGPIILFMVCCGGGTICGGMFIRFGGIIASCGKIQTKSLIRIRKLVSERLDFSYLVAACSLYAAVASFVDPVLAL